MARRELKIGEGAKHLMGAMSNVMQLKRKGEKNQLLRQLPSAATRMVDVAVLADYVHHGAYLNGAGLNKTNAGGDMDCWR